MQLRALLFVSCLMLSGYTYTMDYTLPVDPQMASILHTVPSEIVPKFLWMDTSWDTVRSVLALQQTCWLWCSMLNSDQRKKMVSLWCRKGKDFGEHSCLCLSLQTVGSPHCNQNTDFTPEIFLLAGANVNYATEYGDSVLMFAINADYPSISHIRMLIKMGAAINHQNVDGDTALHFAARNAGLQCVEIFLQHGADKTIKNKEGKRPLESLMQYKIWKYLQRIARIRHLLEDAMTPEESIANPIIEEAGSNAKEPVNEYAFMDFFGQRYLDL